MSDLILELNNATRTTLLPLKQYKALVKLDGDSRLVLKDFFKVGLVPDVCRYKVTVNAPGSQVAQNQGQEIDGSAFWDMPV